MRIQFQSILILKKPFFPHSYLDKRNQHWTWSGYDSEELWHANFHDPERRRQLAESGWLGKNTAITYDYNHQGFRDDAFDDRPCGIALGCSYTEGIGVAAQDTWPSQLTHLVGFKVWNLGIGGVGIDTCFRAMDFWIPILKPRFVALLDPPIARLEICRADGGYTNLLTIGWENSDATSPQDKFVRHWFAQEKNWQEHHRRHILAMRMLAQDAGVPFVHIFNGPIMQPSGDYKQDARFFTRGGLDILDRARDLAHAGPKTLKIVAQAMYEQLMKISAL